MKAIQFVEKSRSANMNEVLGSTSVSKEIMSEIQGGARVGYVASVSGDCNGSGKSCWHDPIDAIGNVFKTIFG